MINFKVNKKLKINLIFLSFFLFLALLFLATINLVVISIIAHNRLHKVPFAVSKQAKIPVIKLKFVPQISAKGAIIMDADSKVVLYSKNQDLRFSTASTAKIMTSLTALEHFKINDYLLVKKATNEGSIIGLREGQLFKFEDLLYAMMLSSANDAAFTIAQNYPGGYENFIIKMNKKASDLKLFNTHYSDPAGLEDSGDYTTPFDLARLSSFAIANPKFSKIVGTKKIVIYDSLGKTYNLENLNRLLGENGVNGIKTGYTEEAGQVLATSVLENGKKIIIVVMGSKDRFLDTSILLDLVSGNITYLSIHP